MKKFLAFALALTMLLSLAACGSSGSAPAETQAPAAAAAPASEAPAETPAEPEVPAATGMEHLYTKPTENVTLEVWYAVSGVTGETFEAKVKAYQEANPNVVINLSYAGSYSDAASKISANLLTGTAPDVALMAAGPLYTGARGDFRMEGLIQDPAFDKSAIYDGVWDYAEYDNRVCALPYGISVPVLYYNKTILEAAGIDIEQEAPKTWDELYALAEKAQQNGNVNNVEAFYGFETSDAPWLFKSMLNQNGNSIVNVDGLDVEPVYNDATAAEVASFWQKLTANGIMPVGEHANAEKTFLAGNCAFIVASSVRLARWSANPSVEFGTLEMPSFNEKSVALGGNVLITFSEDDTKLAASWDLLKYLVSEENHTDFALTTGYIPIYKSAMDTERVKNALVEDPRREVVYDALNHSWSYTHFDAMGTMDGILGDTIASIEGGTDVQTALDKGVDDLINEL